MGLQFIHAGLKQLDTFVSRTGAAALIALLLRPDQLDPRKRFALASGDEGTIIEGTQLLDERLLITGKHHGQAPIMGEPCLVGILDDEEGAGLVRPGTSNPAASAERRPDHPEGNAGVDDHRPVRVVGYGTKVTHVRILMVPPRYGSQLVGGAENLVGALAQKAAHAGMEVEVATTCAADNETWANLLPPGESAEDGIRVHRFPVAPRDERRHAQLAGELTRRGTLSVLNEIDFMATSVWSEGLQRFIDREGQDFDAVVLAPYLVGTTFWGAQAWPNRTAIIPCLHDEPTAHLPSVQAVLRSAATLLFNTAGEERLAGRLLGPVRGTVVGMGFDPPLVPADTTFAKRHGLERYVLYAGRLEHGKRVHIAAQYVADFAKRHDPSLRLVVIGNGSWQPPADLADFVCLTGFVDHEEKRAAMAGAIALVNPSERESFSIVLLESWLEGTPVIVAAGSEVMADHCDESGGGLTFSDGASFATALAVYMNDEEARRNAGERGRAYVMDRYEWDGVLTRFRTALASLG